MSDVVVLGNVDGINPESTAKTVRRFYVDTHVNMKKRYHVVYDGQGYRRVKSLAEISAEIGDEVYIDALHVGIYEDVLKKLLRRGVKVFVLRRTDILSELRIMNNTKKTHEGDARLLSTLEGNFYRELSVDEVGLRMLIVEYNKYSRLLKTMKQLGGGSEAFSEAMRIIRREKDRIAREIVRMAETTIPDYRKVCERLRLSHSSLYGKVALADMLINIDFSRGFRKILCFVGCYQNNQRRYSHRERRALESLAIAYYKKHKVWAKELVQLLKLIKKILTGCPF